MRENSAWRRRGHRSRLAGAAPVAGLWDNGRHSVAVANGRREEQARTGTRGAACVRARVSSLFCSQVLVFCASKNACEELCNTVHNRLSRHDCAPAWTGALTAPAVSAVVPFIECICVSPLLCVDCSRGAGARPARSGVPYAGALCKARPRVRAVSANDIKPRALAEWRRNSFHHAGRTPAEREVIEGGFR